MIYLAAPYWHDNPDIRAARVDALCAFHQRLILHPPRAFYYNPLANSIGAASLDIPEAYWRNHGLHILALCQSVYVYQLPGWEISLGVQAEIALAHKLGLPVHYFSLEAGAVVT